MIIKVRGAEHRFWTDATPRSIDALIREQAGRFAVGNLVFTQICHEELTSIYRSNGWEQAVGCAYNRELPIPALQSFFGLVERPLAMKDQLVGPYIMSNQIISHGLGLWVPKGLLTVS